MKEEGDEDVDNQHITTSTLCALTTPDEDVRECTASRNGVGIVR
jgi:hypothetical protein